MFGAIDRTNSVTNLVRLAGLAAGMSLLIWSIVPALPVWANPPQIEAIAPEQARDLIQQARDAWVAGDAAAFAALFTADGELIVPGKRWQSPAAIETESAHFLAQQTVEIEIQTIIIDGNQAAVAWNWQETSKATGRSSRAEDVILVEFAGGKIRRWREYIDTVTPGTVPP